ncbi:ADP-ribosylation factor-like protein [Hamiltosporidium tvaerminnensis]|uniref:ADP-ribosylation factor-like protein n=1 Tax=Hamiltosporidium tvaerminnensis TaxID=1176355 RepID=A0A4Q9LX76_9MICR|nr:ADP-ribosylation factor-like protein [Hamiltosporidium tvaerminnensis]
MIKSLYQRLLIKRARVLVIGLEHTGKSSFIPLIFNDTFEDNQGPSSVEIKRYAFSGITFVVYDIPGGRDSIAKWDHYYKKADLLIFFVNSAAQEEELAKSRDELKNLLYRNMWLKKSILILGNKNDLDGSISCKDIILKLDLLSIVDREVACYSVSGKKNINTDLVRDWLVEQTGYLSNRRYYLEL